MQERKGNVWINLMESAHFGSLSSVLTKGSQMLRLAGRDKLSERGREIGNWLCEPQYRL